mmetsp:Transcript_32790/g.88027  ORF Transcript_32790/g.88027 Transcript_32790/m.88027 type:complete len:258 (-) Transcript_32790:544-1317(-)
MMGPLLLCSPQQRLFFSLFLQSLSFVLRTGHCIQSLLRFPFSFCSKVLFPLQAGFRGLENVRVLCASIVNFVGHNFNVFRHSFSLLTNVCSLDNVPKIGQFLLCCTGSLLSFLQIVFVCVIKLITSCFCVVGILPQFLEFVLSIVEIGLRGGYDLLRIRAVRLFRCSELFQPVYLVLPFTSRIVKCAELGLILCTLCLTPLLRGVHLLHHRTELVIDFQEPFTSSSQHLYWIVIVWCGTQIRFWNCTFDCACRVFNN